MAFPRFTEKPKSSPPPYVTATQSSKKIASSSSLEILPPEILDQIFSYLDQTILRDLITFSSSLTEAAAVALYERPRFASTYRFAQFVTTISQSKRLANMVRVLDLSELNETDVRGIPMAGWREWKMRTEVLYTLTDKAPEPSWRRDNSPPPYSVLDPAKHTSSHPRPHRFLKQWATCRDVPVGAILHTLTACKGIR